MSASVAAAADTGTDIQDAAPTVSGRAWSAVDLLLIALLAVLAAVPRTVNLLGLDPFIDEVAWVDWAVRQFAWDAPRSWLIPLLTDGRPPLFVWLTAPVAVVVDNGFLAGRLTSALAGVGSTVALYALGREVSGRATGLIAGILWALCPFSVFFARIAADDTLLTLMAVLVVWVSVRLARRPTVSIGVWCGAFLALAVLAKTTGVLLSAAPVLAIVTLGRPQAWQTYLRPLGAVFVAGLVVSLPLLIGIGPMVREAAAHTGGAKQSAGDLFSANLSLTTYWLDTFLGYRFLALVGAGGALALVMRQRALVFVALLGAGLLAVLLAISSPLFSRYLLIGVFPAFLLAGYVVDRAGWLAGMLLGRLAQRGPALIWSALAVRAVVVGLGIVLALSERGQLAVDVVLDPSRAAIPDTEHFRYVEQWFAGHGLGQIAGELRARAANGPVTLLAPPASRENRVLLPHNALRFYLRRDPSIRIEDAPPLFRAQDLRELRRQVREGPTYLVVNGSHTPASGMPDEIPVYTRQLERRLQQDLPDAREVLRVPRPSAPNWLSLYRLDPGD